jgi:hypothetical protein
MPKARTRYTAIEFDGVRSGHAENRVYPIGREQFHHGLAACENRHASSSRLQS